MKRGGLSRTTCARLFVGCWLALPLHACVAEPLPAGSTEAAVVYGSDDRVDVYATEIFADLARSSVVSLIETAHLDLTDPSNVRLRPEVQTLASAYSVCATERFRDQPTAARCSGTLIDDDLVLTAGHCMRNLDECRAHYFVFGYAMEDENNLATITREDVFTCRDLVARTEGEVDSQLVDFAIVQLDRPATPAFVPLPVDTSIPAMMGSPAVVIGSGSGLPLKIDAGGTVRRATGEHSFFVDTDTFGGNSGSGVLSTAGEVRGILVKGQQDYVEEGGCYRVNTLSTATDAFEEVTYAGRAVGALCDLEGAGWPSARLCGPAASCGDGRCTGSETNATCATDCAAPRCGDGVCNVGEDASCASDCVPRTEFPTIPPGWSCPVGFYANHDGCHCGCGVADIDCDDTWQDTRGCGDDEFCSARSAVCISRTAWTCDEAYYEDGECDCGCGSIEDADCADPDAPRYGCEVPSESVCAVSGPVRGASRDRVDAWPWAAGFLFASVLGALARRRRRR